MIIMGVKFFLNNYQELKFIFFKISFIQLKDIQKYYFYKLYTQIFFFFYLNFFKNSYIQKSSFILSCGLEAHKTDFLVLFVFS
jgi:hypothetical protein